jgi:hypothetical protein
MSEKQNKRRAGKTCVIPDCVEPALLDNICGKHAAKIYTTERLRVLQSLIGLFPDADLRRLEAFVTQLEHLCQMMARSANAGVHFEQIDPHKPDDSSDGSLSPEEMAALAPPSEEPS